MGRFTIENLGEMLGIEYYNNHYIKLEYDKSGSINEKFFMLVDGVEEYYDNSIVFGIYEHRINFTGNQAFQNFSSMVSGKIPFLEICDRAREHNKTIIGYEGMAKKSEKIFVIRCNICGYETTQFMRYFYKCLGCMKNNFTKPFIQFVAEAKEMHEDKFLYDEEGYVNCKSKIRIFCKKCQKHFTQMVKVHLNNHGCPYCNESKGEAAIAKYLNELKIKFYDYHGFPGLVHKNALKYDFYLYELNLLIEFDGEHHFKVINRSKDMSKNIENFEQIKIRDKIKDKWALDNNIPLLRIPYWDFDKIKEIIDNFISFNTKKEIQLEMDI